MSYSTCHTFSPYGWKNGKKLAPPKETPREDYERIYTLATELRTVFIVNVTDDMVRRAFFKDLPDNEKNSFLQLNVTPPFLTGSLHYLCIEVIKRHKTLMATLSEPVESINF